MKKRGIWTTAFSGTAAAAGVGIVSGRQAVVFFAQMQDASWIAVAISAVVFGALCGTIIIAARRSGEESFLCLCAHRFPEWLGKIAGALYCLIQTLAAAAMLAESGKLAALTLPVRNAYGIGIVLALGLASALCLRGMRCWGIVSAALCVMFYTLLALDPRPVSIHAVGHIELKLADSVSAAVLLGGTHGALCALMAVQSMISAGDEPPIGIAMASFVTMGLLLSAVNLALLRGGEELLCQALPAVLLAARSGKTGYYGCIWVKWMCTLSSLTAAIGALIGKTQKRRES